MLVQAERIESNEMLGTPMCMIEIVIDSLDVDKRRS